MRCDSSCRGGSGRYSCRDGVAALMLASSEPETLGAVAFTVGLSARPSMPLTILHLFLREFELFSEEVIPRKGVSTSRKRTAISPPVAANAERQPLNLRVTCLTCIPRFS